MSSLSKRARQRKTEKRRKAHELAKKQEGVTLGELGIKQFTGKEGFTKVNVLDRGSTARQMPNVRKRQPAMEARLNKMDAETNKRFGLAHHESGKPNRLRPILEAALEETKRMGIPLIIVTPSRLARSEEFNPRDDFNELPTRKHLESLLGDVPRNLIFTMSLANLELEEDREFLVKLEGELPKPKKRGKKRSPVKEAKRQKAQKMRKEGKTLREIAVRINIPLSTVKRWCKND